MDTSLLPLAYLLPVGLLLSAWGAVPTARLRESALAAVVTIVASAVAYVGFGFAFQFGGIGLSPSAPAGLTGLDKAWSLFASGAGRWSMIGLEGFFVTAQGSPDSLRLVETLALHRLPMAIAAGLIPVVALGDRVNRVALIAAGVLSTAIVFPIVGAWVWGGGWLATLGLNLNLGHGAIDVAGSGVVYLASASVALIALRFFGRTDGYDRQAPTLPTLHQPLFALLGAVLFGIGWSAWAIGDPLLSRYPNIDFVGVATTGLTGAAASAIVATAYIWLASGRIHFLTSVRGWLAGWVAVSASAWFIPPGVTILIGALAGIVSIIGQYAVGYKWGLDDRAGMLATCGAAGAWGLIALGLFADGAFGAGWNGVGAAQGVKGFLASDPGQLTAQLAAWAAIGAFAVCITALLLLPLSIITRRSPAGTPLSAAAQSAADASPPASAPDVS